MDSLSKFNTINEDELINYLKISYSESDLYSLCRHLKLEKEDIFSQYLPFKKNCENFVDEIKRRGYFHRLFLLLQSLPFYRERLLLTFPELDLVAPEDYSRLDFLTQKLYEGVEVKKSEEEEVENYHLWIKECKERMVLILGKDSPDDYMRELENIGEYVKRLGYNPIFIKKQKEVEILSNEEKMLSYAALARFIIIEKSYAAGQIDEAKICAINRLPAIWLQKEGMGDTWMQGDYEADFKFIKTIRYNESSLESAIKQGVSWVEGFIETKQQYLNETYFWRNRINSK
ncbi:hypothetical protein COK34_06980 [Bacillus thuringiensis]|uniref:hypothetical protein n=1 Tax=Bacillus thuringiensis TaxID=1428 RepID=UPI000BFA3BA3|nr:hypothetical protein [Bacillus thuringiensis]PFD66897.1 hypothetical protein CN309_08500 [Bacillus thuringiensis]PFO46534.1 hypothetical protein COJ84_01335 [Bacillus thuringiensis]PFR56352.1 hypothetical protein COK34_06980 [Bacillus thuringiensis]